MKKISNFLFLTLILVSCVSTQPVAVNESPMIAVHEPSGVSVPMAKALAKSVVIELERRGYGAGLAGSGNPTFVLNGSTETLGPSHAPRVAAISWVLSDAKKNEIAFLHQFVSGTENAWAYGSPVLIQTIGKETAANLSPFLDNPDTPQSSEEVVENQAVENQAGYAQSAEKKKYSLEEFFPEQAQSIAVPVSDTVASRGTGGVLPKSPSPPLPVLANNNSDNRPLGVWVDEVSGAPGDGNKALTIALIKALEAIEMPFSRTAGKASHYIQGVVDVAVLDATTEHVTIVWVVRNQNGEEIGRVNQRNDIDRGSLHEDWNDTALFAARGGVEGITAILERDLGN